MNLDTLLRESATAPDPTAHVLRSGREALDTATATTALGGPRVIRMGRARRSRSRRLALTAVGVAAATAALVIAPTVDLSGGRPPAVAGAAPVLLAAAAAAGEQPGGWPDAAYWHSVSSYHQGSGATYRREIWIGHHTIGVLKDDGVNSGVIPLDVGFFPAGSRGLTWDQLYALPTESHALETTLRAGIDDRPGKPSDQDAELFVIVGDLLRESPAAPPLRKALWEVAARIPGVTLVGAVTDRAGRPGVAVELGDQRYVVNPGDGRLLEESQDAGDVSVVAVDGGSKATAAPSGGGVWIGTYLDQGPTDSAPAGDANLQDQKG